MRVALTGTPGTGKSTAAERVDAEGFDVVHLNDRIREAELYEGVDEDRDSLLADVEAIEAYLAGLEGDLLVDSHLAHEFGADRVIVLRCHPAELESRLVDRGEPPEKARENAESEALDLVLSEAVERHGRENVYEIETTDRRPAAVARRIEAAIAGDREPSAGTVSYLEYL